IPKNSTAITHYAVGQFDTNYDFIEATAQHENLKEFIKSKKDFSGKRIYSKADYSQYKFDQLFGEKPEWWTQTKMSEFEENHLVLFADSDDYGYGCWFFYDNDNSKVRLFTWSQQWLTQDKVIKTLNLR
ncbi:MAG: hypothetical protein ACYSOZ_08670, partial [Planctomycetota bacterium]